MILRKLLGAYTAVVLGLLYAPIAVMALFSFNEAQGTQWSGWSLRWYRQLWQNHEIRSALGTTLVLATVTTALSTVLGTCAALAARDRFRGKKLYALLVSLPVMVPDIVLAIALLSLILAAGVGRSLLVATVAHTTFNLSYVAVVVSARLANFDRSVELAARDLGAGPLVTFFKVTLPAIRPGVLSGAVLAFTLSFDDFVLTYFTTGPGDTTLPVHIYSMVRFGVTPEINALSTLILLASLGLIVAALKLSKAPLATGGGR